MSNAKSHSFKPQANEKRKMMGNDYIYQGIKLEKTCI